VVSLEDEYYFPEVEGRTKVGCTDEEEARQELLQYLKTHADAMRPFNLN